MRGRKPKPTVMRELHGNPSRRPYNSVEPLPLGNLAEPPDWMSEDQKTGWRYVISNVPAGLLKRLDLGALVVWVTAESLHREAVRKVAELGLVVRSPQQGMPVQNPYLPIVNRQAVIMLRAAADLGFTPAARARVRTEALPLFPDLGDVEDEEEAADEASADLLLQPRLPKPGG